MNDFDMQKQMIIIYEGFETIFHDKRRTEDKETDRMHFDNRPREISAKRFPETKFGTETNDIHVFLFFPFSFSLIRTNVERKKTTKNKLIFFSLPSSLTTTRLSLYVGGLSRRCRRCRQQQRKKKRKRGKSFAMHVFYVERDN